MEIIDVDYTEVPDEPITETWYTCPSCGQLTPTGRICSCGYHPQAETPPQPQAPVKKRRPSILVITVLAIALTCSLFCNIDQRNKLTLAQSQLDAKQSTIDSERKTVSSLREYNTYLEEDLTNLCPHLPISSDDSKFRHDIRHCGNPSLYSQGKEETEVYWMLMHLRRANGELSY